MSTTKKQSGGVSAADVEIIRRQAVKIVLGMAPEQVEMPTGMTRLVEDLGYDSLRLFEMAIALEEHFGVHAPSDEPIQAETLDDVEKLVVRLARVRT